MQFDAQGANLWAMKITAQNYQQMRNWFSLMVAETFPIHLMTPENDPIACLDRMAKQSPGKARQGLAIAISDTLEDTDAWPNEKIEAVNDLLERDGLPTVTHMRVRFSKVVRRVAARGVIKNDVEYYAIRNAVELDSERSESLWKLLAAYEERTANSAP